MDNEMSSTLKCAKCEQEFNKKELTIINENPYCHQCTMEFANEFIKIKSEQLSKKTKKTAVIKNKNWKNVLICLFFICMGLNAILIPQMINSLKGNKVIRKGVIKTDKQTDNCIKNLWQISRMLQEGKLPPGNLVCPVSKKVYLVKEDGENIIVFCPTPSRHGQGKFKQIKVSRSSPIPEVIE
ncbi:hypothetical protein KAI68_02275 [bacterium]|nr:hypothetical protein [bacterium]